MSGAPVSMSGDLVFATAAQGTPLDCLALEASGRGGRYLHLWVPWECNNQKNSSWQTPPPRVLHRQQIETHPSLPGKEAYLLILEVWLEGQASGLVHLEEPTEELPGNRLVDATSVVSLYLASTIHWYPLERSLYLCLVP